MARKKTEKSFFKEVKEVLSTVHVESFESVTLNIAKKFGIKVSSKEINEIVFSGKNKKISLIGLTLDQLGKYILKYPEAVISADYSYPQFHNKTMDSIFIKIDNFVHTEETREELEEEICKWLYSKYEESLKEDE